MTKKRKKSLVEKGSISYKHLSANPWTFILRDEENLWARFNNISETLESISNNIFQGLKTGSDGFFIADILEDNSKYFVCHFPGPNKNYSIEKVLMKPLIKGGEMKKYTILESNKRILFPYTKGNLRSAKELE